MPTAWRSSSHLIGSKLVLCLQCCQLTSEKSWQSIGIQDHCIEEHCKDLLCLKRNLDRCSIRTRSKIFVPYGVANFGPWIRLFSWGFSSSFLGSHCFDGWQWNPKRHWCHEQGRRLVRVSPNYVHEFVSRQTHAFRLRFFQAFESFS